jgi:hypothetical protein
MAGFLVLRLLPLASLREDLNCQVRARKNNGIYKRLISSYQHHSLIVSAAKKTARIAKSTPEPLRKSHNENHTFLPASVLPTTPYPPSPLHMLVPFSGIHNQNTVTIYMRMFIPPPPPVPPPPRPTVFPFHAPC